MKAEELSVHLPSSTQQPLTLKPEYLAVLSARIYSCTFFFSCNESLIRRTCILRTRYVRNEGSNLLAVIQSPNRESFVLPFAASVHIFQLCA